MDKYLVDFTALDKVFNKPKSYKLADVKHLIQKVAFDVVRFRENEDTAQLWRIENSEDGPIIVAMYDDSDGDKIATAAPKTWDVVVDSSNGLNFVYKGEAITRVAASEFGCEDQYLMARWLSNKLATDSKLRAGVLNSISEEARGLLFSKFPELKG